MASRSVIGASLDVFGMDAATALKFQNASEEVKRFVATKLPQTRVDTKNSSGDDALSLAVIARNSEAVAFLLDAGLNPNESNNLGVAPLARACSYRPSKTVVQMLLSHGANPHARCSEGLTAIANLSDGPDTSAILDLLMAHGVDLQTRFTTGSAALIIKACGASRGFQPQPAVAHQLMLRGALFDANSGQIELAIKNAVARDAHAFLRYLHDANHVNLRHVREDNDPGRTLLHAAFKAGAVNCAIALLDYGVDAQLKDRSSRKASSYGGKNSACHAVLTSFLARNCALDAINEINAAATSKEVFAASGPGGSV